MSETTTQMPLDENTQIAQRKAKLQSLREAGQAYPNDFRRDVVAACLHEKYKDKDKAALEGETEVYKLAGRMMLCRVMGKASFATIQDMSGRIQLYIRRDDLPEGVYQQFKQWDLGDIIAVEGTVFRTNAGELSIKATNVKLMTKSLRPLPEKFHGLSDTETRYRQRYVDLIMNEEARKVFTMRSNLIREIRHFFFDRKFMEAETPMMQVQPGGAAAKPFVTHHNALDMPLYLRIAPELFLKRLVVGGFERVFEINRNFRNEGLSTRHNPEFTMLEFYQAYSDHNELMDLTETLLRELAQTITGSHVIPYQGSELDFGKPMTRLTVFDSILKYNPNLTATDISSLESAVKVAQDLEIKVDKSWGLGKVQIEIFEKTVEGELFEPTFITAYPAEVSPLARRNDQDPFVTDRFEFFLAGKEIANGFSELNDPEDQAERFKAQVEAKKSGDDEAMPYDEDYIRALEYGMPPTAGEGIGIDRLAMIFADTPTIKDVILFPHMRPEK